MKKVICVLAAFLLCILPAHAEEETISVSSKSVILIDHNNGVVLYKMNSDECLYAQGLTSLFTFCLDVAKNPFKTVEASLKDVSFSSPAGITDGSEVSIKDLFYGAIMGGYDDCAYVLGEGAASDAESYAAALNTKAQALSLQATSFEVKSGKTHAYGTSANDLAVIFMKCFENSTFKELYAAESYTADTIEGMTTEFKHMQYPGLSGEYKTVTKDGLLMAASSDKDGQGMTAIVMGAKDTEEAEKDLKILLDWGFAYYKNVSITSEQIGTKDVEFGKETVHFSIDRDLTATMPSDVDPSSITVRIVTENEESTDSIQAYAVFEMNGKEISRLLMDKEILEQDPDKKLLWWDWICITVAGIFVVLFTVKYAAKYLAPKE